MTKQQWMQWTVATAVAGFVGITTTLVTSFAIASDTFYFRKEGEHIEQDIKAVEVRRASDYANLDAKVDDLQRDVKMLLKMMGEKK